VNDHPQPNSTGVRIPQIWECAPSPALFAPYWWKWMPSWIAASLRRLGVDDGTGETHKVVLAAYGRDIMVVSVQAKSAEQAGQLALRYLCAQFYPRQIDGVTPRPSFWPEVSTERSADPMAELVHRAVSGDKS